MDVLAQSNDRYIWEESAEWLLLAGAIKSVAVDIIQYDDGFGYCSSADEFTCSREELLEKFVTDLSRFNYVWGAMECAINTIKPPRHPQKKKRGKIRDACYLISRYFKKKQPVLHVSETIDEFINASQMCFGYNKVQSRYAETGEFGVIAIGLYCVYELGNSFAHGDIAFPIPDEENKPASAHSTMVQEATRVVLLSLQMLLLTYYGESEEPTSFQFSTEIDHDDYPLWFVIRGCHIEYEDDEQQLSLFKV